MSVVRVVLFLVLLAGDFGFLLPWQLVAGITAFCCLIYAAKLVNIAMYGQRGTLSAWGTMATIITMLTPIALYYNNCGIKYTKPVSSEADGGGCSGGQVKYALVCSVPAFVGILMMLVMVADEDRSSRNRIASSYQAQTTNLIDTRRRNRVTTKDDDSDDDDDDEDNNNRSKKQHQKKKKQRKPASTTEPKQEDKADKEVNLTTAEYIRIYESFYWYGELSLIARILWIIVAVTVPLCMAAVDGFVGPIGVSAVSEDLLIAPILIGLFVFVALAISRVIQMRKFDTYIAHAAILFVVGVIIHYRWARFVYPIFTLVPFISLGS